MTADEIRLVVALLVAIVIGVAAKHYRETARSINRSQGATPVPIAEVGKTPD